MVTKTVGFVEAVDGGGGEDCEDGEMSCDGRGGGGDGGCCGYGSGGHCCRGGAWSVNTEFYELYFMLKIV